MKSNVSLWVDTNCVQTAKTTYTPSGELFQNYIGWANKNKFPIVTQNRFGRELTSMGFISSIALSGKQVKLGIMLKR